MQNIFLIPTDKYSDIYKEADEILVFDPVLYFYDGVDHYHIYITVDEEIEKEGGFMLDTIQPDVEDFILPATNENIEIFNTPPQGWKKIILTTDPYLIREGVQPIENEFLEWFVNNPNCERIEVKQGFEDGTEYGYNFLDYKIIIP